MIVGFVALLIQQASPPAPVITSSHSQATDAHELVDRAMIGCVSGQIFLENNPDQSTASPIRAMEAGDAFSIHTRDGLGFCQITGSNWTPQGERMALTVKRGLRAWANSVETVQWREPFATERGPSVWTTFERRNASGDTIGVIQLIEPADGQTGELSIAYQTVSQ